MTNCFQTNNISGAWVGYFGAIIRRYKELPEDLTALLCICMEQSHCYRQWWYWGGDANLRVNGKKIKLTSIQDEQWTQVENAAVAFWDEIAAESPIKAKIVDIFRKYNTDMQKPGRPERYG